LLESVLLSLPFDQLPQQGTRAQQERSSELAEVARQIREQPGELFEVRALAERVGYSVDHFSKLFAQAIGCSPKEYAIRARIDRARLLLRDSAMTLGQIAHALGYADVFFFARQFKQRTGKTPGQYRRPSSRVGRGSH
jgi:transcriptional regulator GlxA family with amidase domain